MAKPTRGELEAALSDRAGYTSSGSTNARPGEPPLVAELRGIAQDYAQAFTESAWFTLHADTTDYGDPPTDGVWADLRPSEAERLDEVMAAAIARAAQAADAAIRHELVAGAEAFAEQHPDAPRGTGAMPRRPYVIAEVPEVVTAG